jgi:hypothetical protein
MLNPPSTCKQDIFIPRPPLSSKMSQGGMQKSKLCVCAWSDCDIREPIVGSAHAHGKLILPMPSRCEAEPTQIRPTPYIHIAATATLRAVRVGVGAPAATQSNRIVTQRRTHHSVFAWRKRVSS